MSTSKPSEANVLKVVRTNETVSDLITHFKNNYCREYYEVQFGKTQVFTS